MAKARSAASKGTHYKMRSKDWLERNGYAVGYMERMMLIHASEVDPTTGAKRPKTIPVKQDQFGADLLAMRRTPTEEIAFVQVKLGRKNILPAIVEFGKHPFPSFAKRLIHVWEVGGRDPEVIDVGAMKGTDGPTVPAPSQRSRTAKTSLF